MVDVKQIVEDFKRIKEHLNVDEEYILYFNLSTKEGFCDRKGKIIILGVKNGSYSRRLLIHECVHATGIDHYEEDGYESVIRFDRYSKGLEEEIFSK